MKTIDYISEQGLTSEQLDEAIERFLSSLPYIPRRVLLIPPDITRFHSYAGKLTNLLWHKLKSYASVDVMPALGTHDVMTESQAKSFLGDIPFSSLIPHSWKNDVVCIGVVPAEFVNEVSEGIMNEDIPVEVNARIVSGQYDLMISLGQVVPHEVVGMANWSKNIFVGCGGKEMINKSHILGAMYGMERIMGKRDTPVRKVFDYAHSHYLKNLPLYFFQTVTTNNQDQVRIHGLFIGDKREVYEEAVALATEKNLIFVDTPFDKVVVYLDPQEFRSTWLGNKAIYRTRMAIRDGGQLIILAPGVHKFGEDPENDRLIRKYGYKGREKTLNLFRSEPELQENQSVAAHLVHGSSDDRFSITYCTTLLTAQEVSGVGYQWADYAAVKDLYDPEKLQDGFNTLKNGERIFYISNPALGLWADRNKFKNEKG